MCKKINLLDRKKYLSDFLREFRYAEEAIVTLENAFDLLFADERNIRLFEKLCRKYERKPNMRFSFLKETSDVIAANGGVSPYTVYLLVLVLLSESSRSVYAARKVPMTIWRENMTDLRYTCELCILMKGVYGTYCPVWYDRFFAATRFTFGRLQFEMCRLGKAYEKDGVKLSSEDKVVFIHIPRSGERLSPESVDASCAEACAYFKERYGMRRVVFACHSWLLYPENKHILSETSNLYAFIRRFDVIDVEDDTTYGDVWRLFDVEYTGDASVLPRDTSLRRAYAQRIEEGKPLGNALGVWLYET